MKPSLYLPVPYLLLLRFSLLLMNIFISPKLVVQYVHDIPYPYEIHLSASML